MWTTLLVIALSVVVLSSGQTPPTIAETFASKVSSIIELRSIAYILAIIRLKLKGTQEVKQLLEPVRLTATHKQQIKLMLSHTYIHISITVLLV